MVNIKTETKFENTGYIITEILAFSIRLTTKHRPPNTRLSDNSRIRAILELHHPHYLYRSATVKAPAIRLHALSLGR